MCTQRNFHASKAFPIHTYVCVCRVFSIVRNGPAAFSSRVPEPGDGLLSISGIDTTGMPVSAIRTHALGENGTKADLVFVSCKTQQPYRTVITRSVCAGDEASRKINPGNSNVEHVRDQRNGHSILGSQEESVRSTGARVDVDAESESAFKAVAASAVLIKDQVHRGYTDTRDTRDVRTSKRAAGLEEYMDARDVKTFMGGAGLEPRSDFDSLHNFPFLGDDARLQGGLDSNRMYTDVYGAKTRNLLNLRDEAKAHDGVDGRAMYTCTGDVCAVLFSQDVIDVLQTRGTEHAVHCVRALAEDLMQVCMYILSGCVLRQAVCCVRMLAESLVQMCM
jgi:hypothetical protein